MTYQELLRENQMRADRREALYKAVSAPGLQEADLTLQYTLASGTRVVISGLARDRLSITSAGGNPWAAGPDDFLTLGMLSVDDLRELTEIRRTIEAWRAGEPGAEELPFPEEPFARWKCPPAYGVYWMALR